MLSIPILIYYCYICVRSGRPTHFPIGSNKDDKNIITNNKTNTKMAEINNNWAVPTVAPVSGVHDYATGFIQVGNELNRKYYENRQAHLENLTALSKIEASEYGQELLNGLRSEFNQASAEFEESGMWHRADDFNFEMS